MAVRISSLAKVYLRVKLPPITEQGNPVNPTSDTVQMAFMASGAPASGDWKTASWETDATVTPNVYSIRCLIGPGGTVTLAAGEYTIWTKITDNPESVVQEQGQLEVTA